MRKKRILVLTPIYFPNHGGGEVAIFELYKRLSKDFNIDLICPNFGAKSFEDNGFFKIHRTCKTIDSRALKFFKYQHSIYKKALDLSKKKKYDLIHIHYTFPLGLMALKLKKKLKIPLMITEHHFGSGMDIISDSQNPKIINPFMRYILKNSDKIVSTGITQNNFLKRIGNNKLEFETIELGGENIRLRKSRDEILKELKINKRLKIIFNVGRLVDRKRTDIIIKAASKLKNENFLFLIAGRGPDFENSKKLIKKYKVESSVKLLGYIDDIQKSKYFTVSHAFLSASEFEGAGVTYFEAFASKLPLFAKRNEASEEIIKNNINGFLFDTDKELANLLRSKLKNNNLSKVIDEAYKIHKKRFNWNLYARKYKDLYFKTLK